VWGELGCAWVDCCAVFVSLDTLGRVWWFGFGSCVARFSMEAN
jgi:hypothetical protein